ncbi:hypothetical protein LINPERHAP2_LOCUS4766 [Linum perenne]
MGDELIDIVIRHGGRMDFSESEPKYVGGEENVVGFDTDYLSYRTLLACAKEDLGYQTVHCMWWLPPKKTMASGLRELFGDMEILYGLMIDVKKVDDGQVVIFFEAEKEVSGGWDKEDGNMGDDEGMNSDDDDRAENSVLPPYPPFVVVSDESEDYEPIQTVRRDFSNVRLRQGMKFIDAGACKDFVASYCLYIGADIMWLRSCQKKMEVVYREHCGWRVYGSWNSKKEVFTLKCLGDSHMCPRALVNKQAFAKWIAKTYLEKFRINPKWDISDMKRELQLTYGIGINSNKCYRARNEARTLLEGQLILEVDIHQEEKVSFKRMYVGFSSLFKGFLAGCRPILGFDGCFLKGELPGMILSTVGKDGNNQMFPLAWAVTEGENKISWKWFVELVREQLH